MNIQISEDWNHILNSYLPDNRDIYFREEYVRLYETGNEKAVCCIIKDGERIMLFPFLSRSFEYQGQHLHDFETAYGYGGPIWHHADDQFKTEALRMMVDELKHQNYVAGFVRFHPLLVNYEGFSVGRLIEDRKTIAIDLSLNVNDIWMHEIHTKNRNVIKKGEKSGLNFVVDNDFKYLPDFVRLYDATMDKLDAADFYYFKKQYYDELMKKLPNSFLGVVLHEGKVVSAAIFMYEGNYGHYHLSGSDVSALKLSPNNYMLWHAALELKKRGVKVFHLGGGTTSSDDDSLFCFKSRFSKHTYQFCLGKLIFNQNLYNVICTDWEQKNPDKVEQYKHFLLKYKY